jgi:ankyrin repeat protein
METTTNIFEAAMNGKTEDVKTLLAQDNTLLNAHSADGWTALHLTSYFGRLETMEALLQAGADVTIRTTNNLNNLNNQPLHAAAASPKTAAAACEILLNNGADINAQQHGGFTALHEAAQNGDEATVGLLLARGADTTIRLDNGQTAREIAVEHGRENILRLLGE